MQAVALIITVILGLGGIAVGILQYLETRRQRTARRTAKQLEESKTIGRDHSRGLTRSPVVEHVSPLQATPDTLPADENPSVYAARTAARVLYKESAVAKIVKVVGVGTQAQLNELWHIDSNAYGETSLEFDVFMKWWKAYPLGLNVLFQGEKILGAVGVWPVSKTWSSNLQLGLCDEKDVDPASFRSLRSRATKYWHISGIVLIPEKRGTGWIRGLLGGAVSNWLGSAQISFPITVTALAYSTEGSHLLEGLGFRRYLDAQLSKSKLPVYAAVYTSRSSLVSSLKSKGIRVW